MHSELVQRFVDKSFIGKFGPFVIHHTLKGELLPGKHKGLEIPVCQENDRCRRMLVILPGLEPENPVFDHVIAADPMFTGTFVQVLD